MNGDDAQQAEDRRAAAARAEAVRLGGRPF
jgi:hypothetical protein